MTRETTTTFQQNIQTVDDEFNGEQLTHVFKHYGDLNAIEEIDATNYDHEHFLANYLRNNKPLVIRNALDTFDVGTVKYPLTNFFI